MKPQTHRSTIALPCVVLAIDPGRKSGWALYVHGRLACSGTAKKSEHRAHAVQLAQIASKENDLPLVVVAETWGRSGAFSGARTMQGLGASWGVWKETLQRELGRFASVRVLPQVWRANTIGAGGKSKAIKVRAQAYAGVIAKREVASSDEAEAIVIGTWAAHAGEVSDAIPLDVLERHGFETRARRAYEAAERARVNEAARRRRLEKKLAEGARA